MYEMFQEILQNVPSLCHNENFHYMLTYVPLSQQFSKCGPNSSNTSTFWEHLRNIIFNPYPDLLNQKLWGWGPAPCGVRNLSGDSDVGMSNHYSLGEGV